MPQDWQDAILVPVSKKDNLHCCDNRRGIASLDVVGKMLGKSVQNCLQKLAEKVLPESQCGLRSLMAYAKVAPTLFNVCAFIVAER